MDKTTIKNFATWARHQLRTDVTTKLTRIGISSEEGIKQPVSTIEGIQTFGEGLTQYDISGVDINRRNALIGEINLRAKGSDIETVITGLIEEIAYTWFNRIIALRFMEVNDYLPSKVRVLSSETVGILEPDIIAEARRGNTDLFEHLELSNEDEIALNLYLDENRLDDAYTLLFLRQLNALHVNLPELFQKTDDYAFLLFTPDYTNQTDGVIARLIQEIPESDFNVEESGQVEIIGWLYQYYNEEAKATSMNKKKYSEADIAPVTQLFTPDWIVKYMVQNSLGRYWVDHLQAKGDGRSESDIANDFSWQYYVPSAEQAADVENHLKISNAFKGHQSIEDIKLLDPAMGSGHILVYAFDVFMDIYVSEGYTKREAARLIVEKNIFGLDIDTRAYQLAYFAIMMKVRGVWRRALEAELTLNLVDIPTSAEVEADELVQLIPSAQVENPEQVEADLRELINRFEHGNEYGSLIHFDRQLDFDSLQKISELNVIDEQADLFSDRVAYKAKLRELVKAGRILSNSYETVSSNPPYLASVKMDQLLKSFVGKFYPDSKSDLFAAFMERNLMFTVSSGYSAMINMQSWMFLSSFEKLRQKILNHPIISMVHLGAHAFEEIGGEVVQTTLFVQQNTDVHQYQGNYVRLTEFGSQKDKENVFLNIQNDSIYLYRTNQSNFTHIPGLPIAYWASDAILNAFTQKNLEYFSSPRLGMATADNNQFLRLWFEITFNKIGLHYNDRKTAQASKKQWFPYNKGGAYRKWFGNNDYVVNWKNDGQEIRNFKDSVGKVRSHNYNLEYIFKPSITWNALTSGNFSSRISPAGFLFDNAGSSLFPTNSDNLEYLQALLSTPVVQKLLGFINPTLNYQPGTLGILPVIMIDAEKKLIQSITQKNVDISKKDWDSFETSWDFNKHPLVQHIDDHNRNWTVREAFEVWRDEAKQRFDQLKSNEEELNKIFIELYGLQDELTPEVADKDIEASARRANLSRDIESFISYAVGVMFGRYSLDSEGLAYAGGEWNDSMYNTFIPDQDNVLVITDEPFFEDGELDIVNRFVEFVEVAFGSENLEENLEFIAESIGGTGTARENIRKYFVKDFFKKHTQIYQKRPIYWQADASAGVRGDQKSFKALFYMHRYTPETLATIRINALQRVQIQMEVRVTDLERQLLEDLSKRDRVLYTKELEKLRKQLDEIKAYDMTLAHMANLKTEIDLDDGVKVNYEKIQNEQDGNRISLLTNI